MFAVVKSGGRQYRLAVGDLVRIGKIDLEIGCVLNFKDVLVIDNGVDVLIGSPFIEGALVKGDIVDQVRSRKVIVFKKRRRQNSQRRGGHRQELTVVRIREIVSS